MKKSIFMLMSVILLFGTMVGCSGGEKPAPSPAQSPAAGASSEPDPTEKPKGPLSFSISLPTTGTGGYSARVDLPTEKWIVKMKELFDVDMKVSVVEDEKMGLMFAGGDIPDVVGAYGTPSSRAMSGSVEAGVFLPLTELIKEYTPDLYASVPQAAWDAVTLNGDIYGLPSYLSNPSRRATYIRKDLLEKTGKEVPKTIEEFVDVMRAFKEIGVPHPYAMRENFKYADVVLGAYDVLPYRDQFMQLGDEIVPKFFQADKMQQALQVMKDMYNEGLIPKDFASITSSDFFKNIEGGTAGMWSQNAVGLTSLANNIRQAVPDSDVEIIPSPVGPDGNGGYLFYSPVVTSYYINKNVEKERAIEILKFFEWNALSEEAEMFFTFGVEGETYSVDASGNIDYYGAPDTKEDQEEEGWRSGSLWLIHDTTMSRIKYEMTEDGRKIIDAFDTILETEGLGGIGFYPELEASAKFPDLGFSQQDVGPTFIVDNMVQMVYGVKPISDWPKVLEEYRKRGGDEIIKEATKRYNNNEGVVNLYR